MPNTRPNSNFNSDGICTGCTSYENQKNVNWKNRFSELESLCEKHRGINGNDYDCAIAVSGGKDSHFQVYYMKEVLKMNPVLLSVYPIDWTETGRHNIQNLSDTFGCDIISINPNIQLARKLAKSSFVEIGSGTWLIDYLLYAFPVKMSMKLGIKLLVYGENVNYTYGGKYAEETPSAMMQPFNDVAKPVWDTWLKKYNISEKELQSAKQPSIDECKLFGLEPIYLGYYVHWDTHHNYEVAKRWGFHHLGHEYTREGTIEQYNQIDSIGYLLGQFLKYPKYAHSAATEMASRWIRSGMKTREEMIPIVKKYDKNLDKGIVEKFCNFTQITIKEFWQIMDKWYNPEFFEQDKDGVWHEKFEVGKGML